jgi:[acyl-carrier-protein] S-malonyltransferase
MRITFLFPGQGSQNLNMLSQYNAEDLSTIHHYLKIAHKVTSLNFISLLDTKDESINQTIVTQPLIVSHSLAVWSIISKYLKSEHNITALAGHSLGELTAIAANEMMSTEEAITTASIRAKAMQDCMNDLSISMAVILSTLSIDQIEAIIHDWKDVWLVNDNCPGQVVIGGTSQSVQEAVAALKLAGIKRALELPMSVVSHCPLLDAAQQKLFQHLLEYPLHFGQWPVASNMTATTSKDSLTITERFCAQLVQRVRFREMIEHLAEDTDYFIEVGPGNILTNLLKKITSKPCLSTATSEQLLEVCHLLEGGLHVI